MTEGKRPRGRPRKVVALTVVPARGRGRPAYEPTDEMRNMVQAMAAAGIPQETIAGVLGIDGKTLAKHFGKEIEYGRTQLDMQSVLTLVTTMKEGGGPGVNAAMWWQKSRMGWTERMVVDSNAAPLKVTVELVGDAPPADEAAPRGSWNTGSDVRLVG